MAKSLARIMDQIEQLKREASAIQTGVIDRLKKEIARHGLSAEDLFGTGGGVDVGNGRSVVPKATKSKGPAKFADSSGNTWSGLGKRPTWIHAALNAGGSLEDFLVGKSTGGRSAPPKSSKASVVAKAPKYADDNGNVWGGMGPRPEWIRNLLAAGRQLDDFLIAKRQPSSSALKGTSSVARKVSSAKGKRTARAAVVVAVPATKRVPKAATSKKAAPVKKPVNAKKAVATKKAPLLTRTASKIPSAPESKTVAPTQKSAGKKAPSTKAKGDSKSGKAVPSPTRKSVKISVPVSVKKSASKKAISRPAGRISESTVASAPTMGPVEAVAA